ncbi:MAG: ComEC/Rec2 family competence protein [Solirubrobacterales bacterium]|nr:ComEC/Rec2 family competence protein [Solirubrobacterales bacterium]
MASSPLLQSRALGPGQLVTIAALALALALLPPRGSGAAGPGAAWLALVTTLALATGALAGGARLAAIDGGALRAPNGARAELRGDVASVPRRDDGKVDVEVAAQAGRVLVSAPEPVPELRVGDEVEAAGVMAEPEDWQLPWLRRRGIAMVLRAGAIDPTGGRRGGVQGRLDSVRNRAEAALEKGMPELEAALARGFVLGQDDSVDPGTRTDFKRSGLAHILAVSGQNVVLLCILAWPLLALVGLTLRARLICLIVLVALYVPLAGAAPSIQRAGVMGIAGIAAALAGRPAVRWYVVLVAATATLAVNPRTSGDIGWQLSFAAVIGIILWTARLTPLLAGSSRRGSPRHAVAEGAAVTIAATVATAPLMAAHFDSFSLASLPANLLALPAVAPAMWLGMLSAIAGQVPGLPVEPLNAVNALLVGYVAQVAHWLAAPGWALVGVRLNGPGAVAAAYALLAATMALLLGWGERRRGMSVLKAEMGSPELAPGARRRRAGLAIGGIAVLLATIALVALRGRDPAGSGAAGLRVEVIDVGQGDSILLDPPKGEPVLIDAGPEDAAVAEHLRSEGVGSLAAAIATHDQSDHAGGIPGVLATLNVERFGYAMAGDALRGAAAAAGSEPLPLAEGDELRSGALHLEVLWPPRELLGSGGDPNETSLVLLAEWRHFSMLLTGDAESDAVPYDPGPVDVLKLAHHGSEDAGLSSLLEGTVPKLAVISVGEGNSYGHPTAEALGELRGHGVPAMRTDLDGDIEIRVSSRGWGVTG